MQEETAEILKTSFKKCASTELHVFDLGMKCYLTINHPERLKLSIMHFICFNCLATAYVDTHVHYHSHLLLSIPIWYLIVKEKLLRYKNKSPMQFTTVAEREGRKKMVAGQFHPSRCYTKLPDVFLAFIALL